MDINKNSLFDRRIVWCLLLIFPLFPFNSNAQFIAREQSGVKPEAALTDQSASSNFEQLVFRLINQKRLENNLPSLVWNKKASDTARLHSSNMARNDFFSHVGLDGKRVDDRANQMGLRNWRMIGENIAYNRGYAEPAVRVVESWIGSSGHRSNILNGRWKETGIGISEAANGTYYFTQIFLF